MMAFQEAWGWPAALYLFLGGLAAGTFAAASMLLLSGRKGQGPAVAASYWLATASLGGGLVALASELGSPVRAAVVWESFSNPSSWMAVGAWAVMLAFAVFLASSLLTVPPLTGFLAGRWRWLDGNLGFLRSVLASCGTALAIFVACYTGLLLKGASGVPFWDSWLLPALFAASAMVAGANAVAAASVATGCARALPLRIRRRIVAAMMGLTVLEGAALAAYLLIMLGGGSSPIVAERAAAAASAESLVSGAYAAQFWLMVVATGLVASIALSGASFLLKGRSGRIVLAVGCACALSGECALRFLVLLAGVHADYLTEAVLSVL